MSDKYAYDGMAAVNFAVAGKPVEFEDMIKLGLASRLEAAVAEKKIEVAQSTFGATPSEPEAEVETTDEIPAEEPTVEAE